MKIIILYSILLFGLSSCSASLSTVAPGCNYTAVELHISPERVACGTRSTDEDAIADINLYVFGKDNNTSIHLYSTSTVLSFECAPGCYDVYLLVNLHEDLGRLSQQQTAALIVETPSSYSTLPMAAKTEITVASTLTAPVIVVKRLVAKVAYNITVAPTASDIKLQSVQTFNTPCRMVPFSVQEQNSVTDFTTCSLASILDSGNVSGSFYMFENRQGKNPTITDQRQRSADNAPPHASYLLIQATRGERVLTYRVYLGENNTDNFDVRRNTFHTLNITIHGDDEIDTRMSGYTVSVWDDLDEGGYNGYCIADSPKHLYVRVESSGDAPALSYTIDVATGDSNALSIGGKNYKDIVYAVSNNNGTNSYLLDYAPTVFSSLNDKLRYAVTVRDEYGFCQKFEFTHTFTNLLRVKVLGGGSVTVSSALYTTDTADSKIILGSSCSLRTTASVGCVFEGWYSDETCTTQVSTSTVYRYTAKSRSQTLYAKFVMAEHMPLDTCGTANCYIAPKKLSRYSFDATVMGKGDWSTNIQPKTLYGTTAKVIWETEAHNEYESVVRYAFYEKGRIYFATGSKYGNAVIGLFDRNDVCVWSWHIWAVDYDPETSIETYSSGAKFMDRNLGVLSKSLTDRGLYYQWGRKDPFIYAEKPNTPQTVAATYNLEGYPFDVLGNTGSYLASNFTIAWATAHPTTLLSYRNSWLYTPNPNLWGNTTGGIIASPKSQKSIYDPCPPGWRVPDRAAWDAATFKDCDFGLAYGVNMNYSSNPKVWTFYPYTGYLSGESGAWQYRTLASEIYIWTNEPYLNSTNDSGYCLHIAGGTVRFSESLGQQYGCALRCMRE